jgi:SAM-dependent methyltransferase
MVQRAGRRGADGLHPTARRGFTAGAGGYDDARPDYPTEVVATLTDRLGLGPGRCVVDLGAGTGKLTRHLVATGAEVVAVEPVAAMRADLAARLERVRVVAAGAEATGLPDGSAHAVTAAQSFHWFDADAALAEVGRLLGHGGHLAVVHNRRDLDDPAQAALDELLAPHRGDTPSWGGDDWAAPLDHAPGFAPAELVVATNHQVLTPAGVVARVASISFVAALDDPERRAVLEATHRWAERTALGGEVTLRYVTELRLLARRPAAG